MAPIAALNKPAALLSLMLAVPLSAQPGGDPAGSAPAASGLAHRALYEKCRPSIVGIRARGTLGETSGTGILLDREGTVLTASSVVGRGAEHIRVWLAGPRIASARLLGVRPEDECALLRIEGAEGGFTPLPMGDSDAVNVGDRVYTIGNPENSLINDDQPSLSVGVVSGLYGLRDERMGSTYTGRVIETTAAVNPGLEGGALLDASGRLVGMVILNSSPLRWLGVAIPVKTLAPVIAELQRETADPAAAAIDDGGEAWFGAAFEEAAGEGKGLAIRSVAPDSPAEAAGLAPGDRVVAVAKQPVETPAAFDDALRQMTPGDLVWFQVLMAGEPRELKIKLGRKPAQGSE